MKRLYQALGVISAVCAAACAPFRQWAGAVFFAVLCLCCGAMLLLAHLRDTRTGRLSGAAGWLVRIGNAVFAVWLVTVVIVEGLIFAGAHTDARALRADCVFVLGGGIRGDQPTQTLRNRLAVALDVMERNPDAHIVVCGGQGDDEDYSEAVVMYNWMVRHGADPTRITMETASRNTIQNVENAVALCEKNGWPTDNVAVLSSGFHLFRARQIMRRCGLTPAAIAAPVGNVPLCAVACIREYFSIVKLAVIGDW